MLEFDAASHTYTLDGRRLPSVTQVLKPCYDFSRIDPAVLEHKRQIGVAVHKAVELDVQGMLDIESLHEEVVPYYNAWRSFAEATAFRVIESEVRVFHELFGYAGTADLVGEIRSESGFDLCLIDLKSSATPSPATALQTAAYEGAYYNARRLPTRRMALALGKDGRPKVIEYTDITDWSTFLNVHNWMDKHATR